MFLFLSAKNTLSWLPYHSLWWCKGLQSTVFGVEIKTDFLLKPDNRLKPFKQTISLYPFMLWLAFLLMQFVFSNQRLALIAEYSNTAPASQKVATSAFFPPWQRGKMRNEGLWKDEAAFGWGNYKSKKGSYTQTSVSEVNKGESRLYMRVAVVTDRMVETIKNSESKGKSG